MSVANTPIGSKVHIVWVGGKTSSFVFRGTDVKGPIFNNDSGKRDLAVLEKPYLSMTVVPPRAS